MKFGKQLNRQIEETLPEWRNKFLSYKALKKLVHRISSAPRSGNSAEAPFIRLLDAEIHKLNSFFVEQEEDFIITQKELQERIRTVMETHGPAARRPSETEYAADMSGIRKDIVNFHGEMVLLENYSNINYTGNSDLEDGPSGGPKNFPSFRHYRTGSQILMVFLVFDHRH